VSVVLLSRETARTILRARTPDTTLLFGLTAKPAIQNIFSSKGKAVPLQAWSGPEGSRKLRFPDFMTTVQDGGKVSLTHRPPLPPGNRSVVTYTKLGSCEGGNKVKEK
jgi:hypothetical protein